MARTTFEIAVNAAWPLAFRTDPPLLEVEWRGTPSHIPRHHVAPADIGIVENYDPEFNAVLRHVTTHFPDGR